MAGRTSEGQEAEGEGVKRQSLEAYGLWRLVGVSAGGACIFTSR